ncbi:hypothetical protein OSB04_018181 [Centaurea solstitialis]|uniref:Uncharacterized protein n=1 Tax=Centaurea solstitialis TaxID=347529 RepID=A0AA38WMR0_9ASTR|nr:hypothetical protein OSB04_018181 [Centaurea solstitialis]
MHTSSIFHPLPPTGAPFSGGFRHSERAFANHRNRLTTTAFKKDGNMVDQNMIVLRQRIRKLKADQSMGTDSMPDNWMEWEKTYVYSGGYHSDIYEAVALLQRFLMESRPSVVLALVAVCGLGTSTVAMAVFRWFITSILEN